MQSGMDSLFAAVRVSKLIDETGNVFGLLTVLRRVKNRRSQGEGWIWECRCACGNVVTRYGGQLRTSVKRGSSSNCGCLGKGLKAGKSAFNAALLHYKRSAKARNHKWDLTKKEFELLIEQPCFYCGAPPSLKYKNLRGGILMNGIDRIDNAKGYSIDNCCSCCSRCNVAKWAMSRDEFTAMVKAICVNLCL